MDLQNSAGQHLDSPVASKRPFFSTSVRVDGVFDVLVFLALSGSWLGLLGSWHWALDLLSHFRWQYLAVSLVAVLWTLWRRRRVVMLAAVATLILNGWLIAVVMAGPGGQPVGSKGLLKVVSLNVLTSNRNVEGVIDYLREADADVIFLMEVDERWEEALEVMRPAYPHGVWHAREDNFGVALLSRVPLKQAEIAVFGEGVLPSIEARLTHNGRDLVILGTHPLPPIGREKMVRRDVQLIDVARYAGSLDVPVLVIGDLNASPWSHGMRLIRAGGKLELSRGAWRPTWQVGTLFAIPIDHALCSAPLGIGAHRVGRDVGSDHRPIEVDVYWR